VLMSYVTYDRHGAPTAHYASMKSREPVGHGKTWWPDFGHGIRDHSYQEKYMPHHHIFEKVVKPHTTGRDLGPPPLERQPAQFRHPAPAREALLQDQPTNEKRLAAKEVTEKQGALRILENRQRKIDSWLEDAPIRMAAAASSSSKGKAIRSHSAPSVGAAQITRGTYEKLGYVVGKSKGSTADGNLGAHGSTRRHNPLSFNSLMFSGSVVDGNRATKSLSHSALPRKPRNQWKALPENSFVFDPRTSLPVPRGGWDAQSTKWPDVPAAGRREWSAPVTFDARPKGVSVQALPEWPRSPDAKERGVTASSATNSVAQQP